MVIKNIRPSTPDDIEKVNEVLQNRQVTPPKRELPDDIKDIRDAIQLHGLPITIEVEGVDPANEVKNLSSRIRGHLTNTEFSYVDLSLVPIDVENDPKLVLKRKRKES